MNMRTWPIVAILVIPALAWAKINVSATVNTTTGVVGDQIVMTLTVEADESIDVDPPIPPIVPRIRVGNPRGPSTSTQISIVNGRMQRNTNYSWSYYVELREPGRATIPALGVGVNGKLHRTRPITIRIAGAGQEVRQGDDSQGQQGQGQQHREERTIWIRVLLSRSTAYKGQEIVATYELYERRGARIRDRQMNKIPSFTGFWTETLIDARKDRIQQHTEVINGVRYTIMPLLKLSLFPTSAGTFTIPPLPLGAMKEEPTDRVDFFGRQYFQRKRITVKSRPRTVTVLPLPGNPPAGFRGAVGSYRISSTADHTEIAQGDPVTWTVTVTGTGNIKGLPDFTTPSLSGFRAYDPKVKTKTNRRNGRAGGTKTYSRVLIPLHSGMTKIPGVSLTFFDPAKKAYRTVTTRPHGLSVIPGERDPATPAIALSQSQIRELGTDIAYIQSDDVDVESDQTVHLWQSGWYWGLQAFPVVILLGCFGYRTWRERVGSDTVKMRALGASSQAKKLLKDARGLKDTGDFPGMTAALGTAITELIAGHANQSAAGLTFDQISTILDERDVSENVREMTLDILRRCDRARYAPSAMTPEDGEELYRASHEATGELFRYFHT